MTRTQSRKGNSDAGSTSLAVPEGWQRATISVLLKLGGSIKTGPFGTVLRAAEYSSEGVPVISVGEIAHGFLTIRDDTPRVSAQVVKRLPAYRLKEGDIVFGRKGSVDRSALVGPQQDGWFLGSDGIRLRLPSSVLPQYAIQQLQAWETKSWLLTNSVGSTMASLNHDVLSRVPILIAPRPEQHEIAAAFSHVDTFIANLDKLLEKRRATTLAAMQQLLTGRVRLAGFDGKWRTIRIREIANCSSARNLTGASLPVLTCSKHHGFVDSLGYFKNQVFSKDLTGYKLIRRGQLGYPANHIEEGSIGYQDSYEVALVSPIYVVMSLNDDVNGVFLHRLLKLDAYRQKFATATNASVDRRGSLRWPAFSQISVTLPPFREQNAIAEVLVAFESQISALERRRDKLKQIKQGMMQQLLTGRIRLLQPEVVA